MKVYNQAIVFTKLVLRRPSKIREGCFLYCPSRGLIFWNKGTYFPLLSFLEPVLGGLEGDKGKRRVLFPGNDLLSEQ
ncbi:MAG: hypothetical protein K0R57_855 [Paenibacillaceae bacterium]|nr:hypothetical protein [Paenibacillaceae bacterium]